MENWLVKFIQQEMQISHVKFLIKHSRNMYRFVFCTAQIRFKVVGEFSSKEITTTRRTLLEKNCKFPRDR